MSILFSRSTLWRVGFFCAVHPERAFGKNLYLRKSFSFYTPLLVNVLLQKPWGLRGGDSTVFGKKESEKGHPTYSLMWGEWVEHLQEACFQWRILFLEPLTTSTTVRFALCLTGGVGRGDDDGRVAPIKTAAAVYSSSFCECIVFCTCYQFKHTLGLACFHMTFGTVDLIMWLSVSS